MTDEIDLGRFLGALRRRAALIIAMGVLVTAITGVVSYLQAPSYTSSAYRDSSRAFS